MALRYYWGFDTELLSGGMSVAVTDDDGSRTATVTDGRYAHADMSGISSVPVSSEYSPLSTAVQTALNDGATGTPYTVTYRNASDPEYRISYSGSVSTLTWTGSGGSNLQVAMGYSGNLDPGSGDELSDVRPYYLIVPLIQARSKVRPVFERAGVTKVGRAADGSPYFGSVSSAAKFAEWIQTFETGTPPATFSDNGMPVFKTEATSAVPWSYEHAWEHARTGGSLPFRVDDGSDSIVYCLDDSGAAFEPDRSADDDVNLWTIPFRCQWLGTV